MPRTKSLATLIEHYGDERVFKPRAIKIPSVYKILNREIFNNQLDVSVLIIGFLSSFVFGLLACKWMLKIVNNNNLIYFSFYCFILGIISISLL